jgi:hypothetical protein
MSANDRCSEALSVLRQGGSIPVNNPAIREWVMSALADGRDGISFPPREVARAIRDHNEHLDPYDPDLSDDDKEATR